MVNIKKASKKLIIFVTTLLLFLSAQIAGITYAWLATNKNEINPGEINGYLITDYFDGGTGTEDDPFIITRPIHYFHMAELYQRNSEFAEMGVVGNPYHFQIGKTFEDADDPTAFYVFAYDDFGSPTSTGNHGQYSTSLNMGYYQGDLALLPIGTSNIPFNGEINGHGLEVTNLYIKSIETYTDGEGNEHIVKSSDIGIFGYIEGYNSSTYTGGFVHDIFYNNITIDLTGLDSSIVSTSEFSHEEAHEGDKIYVGYIAGHMPCLGYDSDHGTIDVTNILQNVFVNNAKVVGYDTESFSGEPISNYGLIGYLDNLGSGEVPSLQGIIDYVQSQAPTPIPSHGSGEGEDTGLGWGASLDMYAIFHRMQTFAGYAYADDPITNNFYLYVDSVDDYAGCYYFNIPEDPMNSSTIYLSGICGTEDVPVEVKDGFFIERDIGTTHNYLTINTTTNSIYNSTDRLHTTNFDFEDHETYFYIYTEIDNEKYYINCDLDGNLIVEDTGSTRWTYTQINDELDDGRPVDVRVSTVIGGNAFYITYYNERWCAVELGSFYNIRYTETTEDNPELEETIDVYLKQYQHDLITTTTAPTDFKRYLDDVDTTDSDAYGYKYYVTIGGVPYFISCIDIGGAFEAVLTNDYASALYLYEGTNTGLYTLAGDGSKYYLTYDHVSSKWLFYCPATYYLIEDDGNYLSLHDGQLIAVNSTNINGECRWTIGEDGEIYQIIEGTTYYLHVDGSNSDVTDVTISIDQNYRNITHWNYEETSESPYYVYLNAYIRKQETDYYLKYDSTNEKWIITKTGDYYRIDSRVMIDEDNYQDNYLVVNSASSIGASSTEYSEFRNDGHNHLYIYFNGIKYFLAVDTQHITNNDLYLTTTASEAVEWIFEPENGVRIPSTEDFEFTNMCIDKFGYTYYLVYENYKWQVVRTGDYYLISDGTGANMTYLKYDDGVFEGTTEREDATKFLKTSSSSQQYFIWDEVDVGGVLTSVRRYLNCDNLYPIISASAINWNYDSEESVFYASKSGIFYYLVYRGGEWIVLKTASYIEIKDQIDVSGTDTDVYFVATPTSTSISYNQNEATRFEVHETNEPLNPEDITRILSFDTADSTYYLHANTDTLDVSIVSDIADATEWYIKDSISADEYQSLYITIDDYQYKLTYNGTKWILSNFGELYMVVHNGKYMTVDNIDTTMDLGATTDVSASTKFTFEQVGEPYEIPTAPGEDPIICTEGRIYFTHSGVKFYLIRDNTGVLKLQHLDDSNDATIWKSLDDHEELYTTVDYYTPESPAVLIDSLDYYVQYADGDGDGDLEWCLKIVDDFYTIKEEVATDIYKYLYVNPTNRLISAVEDSSTRFLLDNYNHLYTLIDEVPYFLNKTEGITLLMEEIPTTIWSIVDGVPYTEFLGFNYYPTIIGNNWYCEIDLDYYTITDNDSSRTFEVDFEELPVSTYKTRWYIEQQDPDDIEAGIYLYVVSRLTGKKYYLYNSQTDPTENEVLTFVDSTVSSNKTLFHFDEIESGEGEETILQGVYCEKFDYKFYIAYVDNVWKLKYVGNSFVIKDTIDNSSLTYMTNNGINVIGSTSTDNIKEWYFKRVGNSGGFYIQTIYNQSLYSLVRNTDGTVSLSTSTTPTLWYLTDDTYDYATNQPATTDQGTLYTFVNDVKQHLYYDFEISEGTAGAWKTNEFEFYRLIKDNTGTYIASDGVTISSTSNMSLAAEFKLEIVDDHNALGYAYYFYLEVGGVKYYLSVDISNTNYNACLRTYNASDLTKRNSLFRYNESTNDFAFYRTTTSAALYLQYSVSGWRFMSPVVAYIISDAATGKRLGATINNSVPQLVTLDSSSNFTWSYSSNYLSCSLDIGGSSTTYYLNATLKNGNYTLSLGRQRSSKFYFNTASTVPGSNCVSFIPTGSNLRYNLQYDSTSNSWSLIPSSTIQITYTDFYGDVYSFEPDFENQTITYGVNVEEPCKWYYTGPQTTNSLTPDPYYYYYDDSDDSIFLAQKGTNGGMLYTFDNLGRKWFVQINDATYYYNNLCLTTQETQAITMLYGNYVSLEYDEEIYDYVENYTLTFLILTVERPDGDFYNLYSGLKFEYGEWCMTTVFDQEPEVNLSTLKGGVVTITSTSNAKIYLDLKEIPVNQVVDYVDQNDLPDIDYVYNEVNPLENIYKHIEERPTSFNFDKIPNTFKTIIRLYEQGTPSNILNVTNDDVNPPDNIYIYRQHYDPPDTVGFRRCLEEIITAYLDVNIINIEQVNLILDYNDITGYVEVTLTTYTPIITRLTDYADDLSKLSDPNSASTINSGYIVSGHNSGSTDESDITVTYQAHNSTTSPLGLSLNGITTTFSDDFNRTMEIITYDKENNEYVRITDINSDHNTSHFSVNPDLLSRVPNTKTSSDLRLNGYENYANNLRARDKFAETLLSDPTGVYGIQFKQAQISMSRIITAHNVSLKGMDFDLTKDNFYQMPEDCIDFNVYSQEVDGVTISKGTINFFAGTYYNGNEAFFSLHQIERDPMNQSVITSIKEISKIYGPTGSDNSAMYIYELVGGNTPSLPSGYELVFDMAWLTNPDDVVNNAIYYFEIPVNAGEYALGSVPGKDGAYLMYLDVATMGASEAGGSIIDPEDPTPMLEATPALVAAQAPLIEGIEYRDIVQISTPEDVEELQDPLKIFVGYNVPANATSDNFSIEIKYHKVVADDGYDEYVHTWCKGVYRIYIKNLTAATFDMDVLLVSPDDLDDYDYPYAFEFYLWNGTEYIVMNNNEVSYQPVDPNSDYVGYIGSLRRWSNTYIVHASYIEPANYITD